MGYTEIIPIRFKFDLKQRVFYQGDQYIILSRSYMEISNGKKVIKYNLKRADKDLYLPGIFEEELKGLGIVK